MDTDTLDNTLSALAEGHNVDRALLAWARRGALDGPRLDLLRTRWPTDRLPIIDHYFCVSRLGKGGAGVVFKALAVGPDPRFVALKLLQYGSEEEEERFRQREIEILKALRCPYVCRYLDSGRAGGTFYLAMELAEGQPLDDYLAEHTDTIEEKLIIFQRLCDVVARLHDEGVVHRDLKPKHVLIDKDRQPWIVDFGLSTVRSGDWSTRVRRAQTELGRIIGTFRYMSPEQAWGALMRVDRRTDIWSLGVMLYEIVTGGDHPYNFEPVGDLIGDDALLFRIQTEAPKKPVIRSRRYAQDLETLISRCLAYEPNRRLDSAAALADDLRRCLADQSILTRPLPVWHHLQRIAVGLAVRWRFGLWASTICAILVLLFLWSVIGGVRWRVSGEDYSEETRDVLKAAQFAETDGGVLIAGISDRSIEAVVAWAARHEVPGVSQDVRSWRAVHGRLMSRLAAAGPRAVLWDYYFRTPQPGDAAFVDGVQTLLESGVPVVLAAHRYSADGRPDLSAEIFEPLADRVHHGLILARDMVKREGEFILSLRRGDQVIMGMPLSAFAAVVHPTCKPVLEWQGGADKLRVVYYPRSGTQAPAVDRVALTLPGDATKHTRHGARRGDVLGVKAFGLRRDVWDQPERLVSYESLLHADDEGLARRVRGRVLLFGDVRAAHPFLKRDRHPVRYGGDIVEDVPGCYLIADAVRGLLTNWYLALKPPQLETFAGILLLSFMACVLPARLAAARRLSMHWSRGALILVLLGTAVAALVLVIRVRTRIEVHVYMFTAALCLALAASFSIEWVRHRYRRPGPVDRGSGS